MLSDTAFLLKIGPVDMKYWRLWHFSLSSNKLMTMLNISLYIKVRITKICETYAGEYQSFQSVFSAPLPTSALRAWLVFWWTCVSASQGHILPDFKESEKKLKLYFLQIITYLGKRNTYRRHVSISYFIEKLLRLTEVYCHLLLPKNYLIIGYFNI